MPEKYDPLKDPAVRPVAIIAVAITALVALLVLGPWLLANWL